MQKKEIAIGSDHIYEQGDENIKNLGNERKSGYMIRGRGYGGSKQIKISVSGFVCQWLSER